MLICFYAFQCHNITRVNNFDRFICLLEKNSDLTNDILLFQATKTVVNVLPWREMSPSENIAEIERAQGSMRALRSATEERIRTLEQELSERDDPDVKQKGLRSSSLEGKLSAEVQAKETLIMLDNLLLHERKKCKALLAESGGGGVNSAKKSPKPNTDNDERLSPKDKEKEKEQPVERSRLRGSVEVVPSTITQEVSGIRSKYLPLENDKGKSRDKILSELESIRCELKEKRNQLKSIESREKAHSANTTSILLDLEKAKKILAAHDEKTAELSARLEELRKDRKDYDVLVMKCKVEVTESQQQRKQYSNKVEEYENEIHPPGLRDEKITVENEVVRLNDVLKYTQESLKALDNGSPLPPQPAVLAGRLPVPTAKYGEADKEKEIAMMMRNRKASNSNANVNANVAAAANNNSQATATTTSNTTSAPLSTSATSTGGGVSGGVGQGGGTGRRDSGSNVGTIPGSGSGSAGLAGGSDTSYATPVKYSQQSLRSSKPLNTTSTTTSEVVQGSAAERKESYTQEALKPVSNRLSTKILDAYTTSATSSVPVSTINSALTSAVPSRHASVSLNHLDSPCSGTVSGDEDRRASLAQANLKKTYSTTAVLSVQTVTESGIKSSSSDSNDSYRVISGPNSNSSAKLKEFILQTEKDKERLRDLGGGNMPVPAPISGPEKRVSVGPGLVPNNNGNSGNTRRLSGITNFNAPAVPTNNTASTVNSGLKSQNQGVNSATTSFSTSTPTGPPPPPVRSALVSRKSDSDSDKSTSTSGKIVSNLYLNSNSNSNSNLSSNSSLNLISSANNSMKSGGNNGNNNNGNNSNNGNNNNSNGNGNGRINNYHESWDKNNKIEMKSEECSPIELNLENAINVAISPLNSPKITKRGSFDKGGNLNRLSGVFSGQKEELEEEEKETEEMLNRIKLAEKEKEKEREKEKNNGGGSGGGSVSSSGERKLSKLASFMASVAITSDQSNTIKDKDQNQNQQQTQIQNQNTNNNITQNTNINTNNNTNINTNNNTNSEKIIGKINIDKITAVVSGTDKKNSEKEKEKEREKKIPARLSLGNFFGGSKKNIDDEKEKEKENEKEHNESIEKEKEREKEREREREKENEVEKAVPVRRNSIVANAVAAREKEKNTESSSESRKAPYPRPSSVRAPGPNETLMPAPTSAWPNYKLTKAQTYLVAVIDDADKSIPNAVKDAPSLSINPNPSAAQSAREIFMAKLKAQQGGAAVFPKGNMYVSKGIKYHIFD
jgi:hypothetical protein